MDKAPDAFRTISEVADSLDVPQHVLRFWETRFAQIRPMKRSGGRRYYRPDDIDLLRGIRRLLYGEGYTIRGVQKILKEHGIRAVQAFADGVPLSPAPGSETSSRLPHHPGSSEADDVASDGELGEHDDAPEDTPEIEAGRRPDSVDTSRRTDQPPVVPEQMSQALDVNARQRLHEVLDDLITCRATLEQVLKTHPGKPLPE